MKVLVIGANGALGSDLMRVLPDAIPAVHADFDIVDEDAVNAFLDANPVDVVVNTAAFHRVPDCETEYDAAFRVNVIGVRSLAKACAARGIHLCHISTDYVFDGSKGAPYVETDPPAPLSIYAISKLAGEQALAAYGDNWSVVRGCGLYGKVPTRAKGGNFINTMIRLGKERELVSVVYDEIVAPTYTLDLARAIGALLEAKGRGIFHIANSGETSWYHFAQIIFQVMELPARLESTKASAFQSVVRRPTYSILDSGKFEKLTGHELPSWEDALRRHLADLKATE
ncbi:MAG: dTDP-4-dehydrorhamnose reductase [Acidobacteriota bacterium]|nr:dTDP-4-dehydrorhamnose reductase [Acidobacteriota bacterium]